MCLVIYVSRDIFLGMLSLIASGNLSNNKLNSKHFMLNNKFQLYFPIL